MEPSLVGFDLDRVATHHSTLHQAGIVVKDPMFETVGPEELCVLVDLLGIRVLVEKVHRTDRESIDLSIKSLTQCQVAAAPKAYILLPENVKSSFLSL